MIQRERTDTERLAVLETKVDAVHEDLHAIWQTLKATASRPTWGVTMALTGLSSALVGLIVAFAVQVGA